MLLFLCMFFGSNRLYSQKNFGIQSIVYDTSGTLALTSNELDLLDLFSDSSTYIDNKIILINSIANAQQDGLLYFQLPGDSTGIYFVTKYIEYSGTDYHLYGEVYFDYSSMDSTLYCQNGSLNISFNDSIYLISVNYCEESYVIRHLGRELYVASKYIVDSTSVSCEALSTGFDTSEIEDEIHEEFLSGITTVCPIDVLALYTTSARDIMGGDQNAIREIQHSIIKANAGIKNSGVAPNDVFIRIVGVLHYDEYQEDSGKLMKENFENDVTPLLSNSNSEMFDLRDQYGADFVLVFTNGNWSQGGVAWVGPDEDRAVAMVQIKNSNNNFTTAHEIGHILGCDHQNLIAAPPGVFNHAHRFRAPNTGIIFGKFHETIVHSPWSSKRILHYSNPRVKYFGGRTGAADRDNARVISARGCEVGAFRASSVPWVNAYLLAPYSACFCSIVDVTAVISSSNPSGFSFSWEVSYDGFNWVSLSTNNQSIGISMPCGLDPYEGVFVRVTVSSSNSSDIIRTTFIRAVNGEDEYGNPCGLQLTNSSNDQKIPSHTLNNLTIDVFPNPTDGILNIHFKEFNNESFDYFLYSSSGLMLNFGTLNASTQGELHYILLPESSPPGLYTLVLKNTSNGRMFYKKIINQ